MLSTALIAKLIQDTGQCLYTYPGGTIAPLFHECVNHGVELIVAKAEQGAGYMAIAHSLLKNRPAFVAVTSGPGATNLLTCIADAYYDSIPLVAFTGQVGTADLDRPSSLRQRGFQEAPILSMAKHITKAAFQPRSPEELADMLVRAVTIALSDRPGPVLIDLPMNVQMTAIEPDLLQRVDIRNIITACGQTPARQDMEPIVQSFFDAERPLILVGGGAQNSYDRVRALAHRLNIPVVSSLRGQGILSFNDSLYMGWIGHTGFPWANWALSAADWLLVLGSRLDVRQTGTELDHFQQKTVIHVDVDRNELHHGRFERTFPIHSAVNEFIDGLLDVLEKSATENREVWIDEIRSQKKSMRLHDRGQKAGVGPDRLFSYVDELTKDQKTAVVTGVGSHQQWAARYFSFDNPDKLFFTSAGHGTMGYCLPVAIGIKRLEKERLVLAIDGDGSFQMNIQELALIRQYDLNLKIIIMDNSRLGIVSQFQQITFGDDPTTGRFINPRFPDICEAYDLKTFGLDQFNEETIERWLSHPTSSVLHVQVQRDAPVSPMLLAGQNLDNMWQWTPPTSEEHEE